MYGKNIYTRDIRTYGMKIYTYILKEDLYNIHEKRIQHVHGKKCRHTPSS
jgi:hypothetical protein